MYHGMRKAILMFVSASLLAGAVLSCTGRSPEEGHSGESVYSPSYIQELGASDYEAAMRLTAEGLRKGQLNAFTANELRANLTYQFTEDYASAAAYLHKALEQEEAKDPDTRTDLLYHLATIHRTAKELPACLAACTEGKEIAHDLGRTYDVNAFDFLAGSCLLSMGEEQTGLTMMTEAIAGASAVAATEAQYGHLAHFNDQLINDYTAVGEHAAALQQCAVYEQVLTRMQEAFPDAPAAFLDRSWFYLDLDRAVCQALLGDKAEAAEAFERAKGRRFAETEGGAYIQAGYYAAVGDPAGVLRIFTEEIPYADPDTVTRDFRLRLARLRDAYQHAGMEEEHARTAARYDALSALLEAKENAEGLPEKAEAYDAQHYRLALSDALKALRHNRVAFAVMIGLIIAALGVFILLNRRVTRRKEAQYRKETSALEKDIRSLRKQVTLIAEQEFQAAPSGTGKKGLSLTELIEGNQLYLNKNLNRENAAALLGLSQAEISRMLQAVQPDLSFPDYIKGLRLRHAMQLLGENPDIPIAVLSERCGFYSVRTFQRSFLALTGKTPSEYARALKSGS